MQDTTVFLISCGKNPNYGACRDALAKQTIQFKLVEIKNVRPMSAAYQQMIDLCETPFYVQVDEDMILEPTAVEKLRDAITKEDPKTVMVCLMLYDPHVERPIYGVKIYRHEAFAKYPYDQSQTSIEIDQVQRLMGDGYKMDLRPEVVGRHSPEWSEELIFKRYEDLALRFRLYRFAWLQDLPSLFIKRLTESPNRLDLFALLGWYSGFIGQKTFKRGALDFTRRPRNFKILEAFAGGPVSATVAVTSKCNHRCDFCYRQQRGIPEMPDMDPTIAGDLLRRFPTIQGVCVCGYGEPLMHEGLEHILWACLNVNPDNVPRFVGLITNGELLVQKMPTLSRKGHRPHSISVSLNAANAATFQAATGSSGFETVLAGIRLAIQEGFIVRTSMVCHRRNLEEIPAFLDLVQSLGVRFVDLHNLLPHGRDDSAFLGSVLALEDASAIEAMKAQAPAGMTVSWPKLIDRKGPYQACNFPWRSLSVDGNGKVSICNSILPPACFTTKLTDFVVWNSEEFMQFRERFLNDEIPECRWCFRNHHFE